MPISSSRKVALTFAAGALLIAAVMLQRKFSPDDEQLARKQLFQFVPADATSVFYLDLDPFRESPFLAKLYSWAPHPAEDSEYAQFVHETGFSYERDLQRAMVVISNRGSSTSMLIVGDGKFDRRKIEEYLNQNGTSVQQGKWKIFTLNAAANDRRLSLVFLDDHRIALGDSERIPLTLFASSDETIRAEWNLRLDRLAGTPLFVLVRQDPALQNALMSMAPGGYRSPRLGALLNQLQWISIAGKPDGEQLRVVAEGESLSAPSIAQLNEFLQGIALLAQNGLNDPKVRQQMDPAERGAYLEVLKGADIQKINHGESKSVRVAISLTPKILELAANSTARPLQPSGSSGPPATKTPSGRARPKK